MCLGQRSKIRPAMERRSGFEGRGEYGQVTKLFTWRVHFLRRLVEPIPRQLFGRQYADVVWGDGLHVGEQAGGDAHFLEVGGGVVAHGVAALCGVAVGEVGAVDADVAAHGFVAAGGQ